MVFSFLLLKRFEKRGVYFFVTSELEGKLFDTMEGLFSRGESLVSSRIGLEFGK